MHDYISDKSVKANLKNMGFKKVSSSFTVALNQYFFTWLKKSFKEKKGGEPVNSPRYYSGETTLSPSTLPQFTDVHVSAEYVRPIIKENPVIDANKLTSDAYISEIKGGRNYSGFHLTFKSIDNAIKKLPKCVICKINKNIISEIKNKFETHITEKLNKLDKNKTLTASYFKK